MSNKQQDLEFDLLGLGYFFDQLFFHDVPIPPSWRPMHILCHGLLKVHNVLYDFTEDFT